MSIPSRSRTRIRRFSGLRVSASGGFGSVESVVEATQGNHVEGQLRHVPGNVDGFARRKARPLVGHLKADVEHAVKVAVHGFLPKSGPKYGVRLGPVRLVVASREQGVARQPAPSSKASNIGPGIGGAGSAFCASTLRQGVVVLLRARTEYIRLYPKVLLEVVLDVDLRTIVKRGFEVGRKAGAGFSPQPPGWRTPGVIVARTEVYGCHKVYL